MVSNRMRIANIVSRLPAPAFLVTGAADLLYLTGSGTGGFLLLLTPAGGVIFTSCMLKDQMKQQVPGVQVIAGHGKKLSDLLIAYCKKQHLQRLAVDPGHMGYDFGHTLASKIRIEPAGGFLARARLVKDDDEIACIRQSCRIAAEVVNRIHAVMRPGLTEEYIALKIHELFAKKGVLVSFPPIVASGPNSTLPHHEYSSRKLAQDDLITIDLGCVYKGYCSDLTRTYYFGKMNHLKKKVYSLVAEAKRKATRAIRPGVKASFIDAVARRCIAAGGYGKEFIHTTGHGVGIEVHEAPRLGNKDTTILSPGMVITVEPGIYLSGRFGVRIEDTILVTEKGNEVLTA